MKVSYIVGLKIENKVFSKTKNLIFQKKTTLETRTIAQKIQPYFLVLKPYKIS